MSNVQIFAIRNYFYRKDSKTDKPVYELDFDGEILSKETTSEALSAIYELSSIASHRKLNLFAFIPRHINGEIRAVTQHNVSKPSPLNNVKSERIVEVFDTHNLVEFISDNSEFGDDIEWFYKRAKEGYHVFFNIN